MTIINPNSISGISSITALNSTAAINLFKADGTSANIIAGVTTGSNFITGTSNVHSTGYECTNINASGIITATNVNVGDDLDVTDDLTIGGEFNMIGSSDSNKYFDARIGSSNTLVFRSASGGGGNLVTMLQLGTGASSLVGNLTLADSTDSSSAAGPEFTLNRNSSSPADADYLGQIKFAGRSDTAVQRNYAKITGKILDASNGTEDGIIEFSHIKAGSQVITGRWRSDSLQLLNSTNFSVAGTSEFTGAATFGSDLIIPSYIKHLGDTNTMIGFPSDDSFSVTTNNVTRMTFTGNFIDLPDAGTFRLGNSNDLQIYHGSGGASNIVHSNTSQPLILSATGAGSIRFDTNSGTRLNIASDGKVDIGGSTKTGNAARLTVTHSNNSGVGLIDMDAYGSATLQIRSNWSGSTINGMPNETFGFGTPHAYPLVFTTSGAERVRIDPNGQLLVGTSTSGANVRAVFQGYNGGGENFQARVQFQTAQATNLSTNQHLANLLFTNASSSIGAEIRVQADEAWGTSDYPTRISFLTTANGSGTRYERMIIKNDGVVNIGVASPQYAKKVNIQGDNGYQLSISNQDYTGHAAGTYSGIEGRIECGGSVWSSAGVKFVKDNGTSGDKHTRLELYAVDGYSSKIGLVVQPDGYVTKPLQPSFHVGNPNLAGSTSGNVWRCHANAIYSNVGSHYDNSNGRFTAPVDGQYFFFHWGMSQSANQTCDVYSRKNGSRDQIGTSFNHPSGAQHDQFGCSYVRTLSAGDYIDIYTANGNVYNNSDGRHGGWGGWLIG